MSAGDEISVSFLSISHRTIDQLLRRMCPVICSVPTDALLVSELPAKSRGFPLSLLKGYLVALCCSYQTVV